jgi:lipopolysaccharide transport system permease protein
MAQSTKNLHEEFFGHKHITIIEPPNGLFDLRLRELEAYWDLILLFVRRDFVAQYKQTILGPAWHIIQPLLTTIVFTIVFGHIAKIPTDGLPPFLFYMAGTVIWTYFSSVLMGISNTFVQNASIFGKVYFPRLSVPISHLISRLIAFAIQFIFFLMFIAWFAFSSVDLSPNWWVLMTPILLIMMAGFGLGLGIIVSSMTTRYRDLTVLVGFGVQLMMYASPIIYPLSALPEHWRYWAALNPITPIVEAFRYGYLGAGTVDLGMLSYSLVVIVVVLLAGIVIFNRVERTFMDTV